MAMTFAGFTAIIMILRQRLGSPLSRFDTLVARFSWCGASSSPTAEHIAAQNSLSPNW